MDEATRRSIAEAIRYTRNEIEELRDAANGIMNSIDLLERTTSFMAEVLENETLN